MSHWSENAMAWLPEQAEPLRVRLFLRSPIAHDSYRGLSALEGALQTVVVERESGLTSSEAMNVLQAQRAESGLDPYDIPIPIVDAIVHGKRIAQCSHGQYADGVLDDKRKRRRRSDVEGIAKDKITIAGGNFKALDIPVPTRIAAWIDFFVVGDRKKLEALLPDVMGLARDCRRGLGSIHAFAIDAAEDRSLVWERRPQRAIPVQSAHEAALLFDPTSYEVRMENTRAPYWVRASRALCAVPVWS